MSLVSRWERFWFEPVPPHVYALLRIVFGVLGCAALIGLSDLPTFWDVEGFVALEPGRAFKQFLETRGLGALAGRSLYVVSMLIFAAMAVGYRSAVVVPLAFVLALAQSSWSYFPLSGAHSVMLGVLFGLIWADCGAVWSVDAWMERRRAPSITAARTPIAALRLIRFQVAIIYLNTGLWKLFGEEWRDGSAVFYVLNQNLFGRFSADRLPASLDWVATVATYTTLVWEIAFAALVLSSRTRWLALGLGIVIHLGLLVSIDVGLFSIVMLATYVAYLSPDRVALWFDGRTVSRGEPSNTRLSGSTDPVH